MCIQQKLMVLSGLLTPIIGILTVYIAYQQYKVAKNKTKLDLYEKRYAVYTALMELWNEIPKGSGFSHLSVLVFKRKTNESQFIFDQDVTAYLEQIYQKAISLATTKWEGNESITDAHKTASADQSYALRNELDNLFLNAPKIFMKYLKFHK